MRLRLICPAFFLVVSLGLPSMATAAPSVSIRPATAIGSTTATLNGVIFASDEATVTFEYFEARFGEGGLISVPADQSPVIGFEVYVSVTISGLKPQTAYEYRVVATDASGTASETNLFFTRPARAQTHLVSSVTPTTATLRGLIVPQDETLTVTFEYSEDPDLGEGSIVTTVTADPSPVSGRTSIQVSKAISGLRPSTVYHFRVVATNAAAATFKGRTLSFVTSPPAVITTGTASSVTPTTTTLNGLVTAFNETTTVTFEYGTTSSYGTAVAADQSPVSGFIPTAVTKALTGLTPKTTYHFRVVGMNALGVSNGEDRTFTTGGDAPGAITNHATNITTGGATLNGRVDPNDLPTTVIFEYGRDTNYGSTATADQSPLSDSSSMTVSADVGGIAPGTVVHFRVVATNALGTAFGADETFRLNLLADLSLTKSDSADPVLGRSFGYSLEVENLGPSDASEVTATDDLPAGLDFVSSPDGCTEAGATVTCPFGDLAAGTSATRSYTVELDGSQSRFPITINSVAIVSSPVEDPATANDSDSEQTSVDPEAPQVTLIDDPVTAADGEIAECETVHGVGMSQLKVRFSEAMNDPPGDGAPGDVTNPASWLLVRPGPNTTFETSACGPIGGDDVEVLPTAVIYDAADTATFQTAAALPAGPYRLIACGSGEGGLRDKAGNALDGNGDLSAGDDFVRNFRSDPENALANGHFDCNLSHWVFSSGDPLEIVYSPDDADASADSGSATITNLTSSSGLALGQCIPAFALSSYDLEALVQLSTSGLGIIVNRRCTFFGSPDCTDAELGTAITSTLIGDTTGAWASLGGTFLSPAGTSSALCSVDFVAPAGVVFDARLDQVHLSSDGGGGGVFADGFESGSTARWTSQTP